MTRAELAVVLAQNLDEDPAQTLRWYTDLQMTNAINDGLVVYSALTMAIEATVAVPAFSGNPFYDLFSYEPKTIAVLRVTENGARLTPDRVESFQSVNNAWRNHHDFPERFAVVGSNLLCIGPPPQSSSLVFQVTVAKTAATLNFSGDSPAIPVEDHFCLAEFAAWLLPTCREGASEKANQCIERFFDCVSRRIDQVRDRGLAQSYSVIPQQLDKRKIQAIVGGASERRNRRQ